MRALRAAGELADVLSDYPGSTHRFEESLAIARALGDQRGIAEALLGLAHEAERIGKHAEARPLVEEAVAIFRELGDEPSLARSLGGLAWLENDYRRARELWQETGGRTPEARQQRERRLGRPSARVLRPGRR